MSGQKTSLWSVKSTEGGICHRRLLDVGKEQEMGMLLYLLLFGGFFLLMMRFGCGAQIMGHGQHDQHDQHGQHGQHGDQGADSQQTREEAKRSPGAPRDAGIIARDPTHG